MLPLYVHMSFESLLHKYLRNENTRLDYPYPTYKKKVFSSLPLTFRTIHNRHIHIYCGKYQKGNKIFCLDIKFILM